MPKHGTRNIHYLLLFIPTGLLMLRACMVLSYSADLDGLEFYFVRLIQQLQQGKALYPDPQIFPYSICLYTPLYFYLLKGSAWLLQIDAATQLHAVYILGRSLSLFFVICQLGVSILLLRKISGSPMQILVAISIFTLLLSGHVYAVRPDALKLFFFTLFLYFFLDYLFFRDTWYNFLLCLFSGIAAFLSKQDILLHLGVCLGLALLLLRNRRILYLCAGFLIAGLLCLYCCYALFGCYFFSHIFLFNLQSVDDLSHSYNIFFLFFSLARTAPLLLLTVLNYRKQKKDRMEMNAARLLVYCTLLLYPIVHLSFLRAGANLNYTYELSVLLILNLVLFYRYYAEYIRSYPHRSLFFGSLYLLLLILSDIGIKNYVYSPFEETKKWKDFRGMIEESRAVKQLTGKDTIFFPNTYYSIFYCDKPVVLGHDMHLDRFTNLYTHVYLRSHLTYVSTAAYDANFRNGRVRYILIADEEKSRKHVACFYPYYHFFRQCGNMLIYQYTPSQTQP